MQHFSVSVLGEEHRGISDRFARAGEHKWSGVKHRLGEGGVPVLEDAAAAFEMRGRGALRRRRPRHRRRPGAAVRA